MARRCTGLLARYLLAHTTAQRIEAATDADNIAERRRPWRRPDSAGTRTRHRLAGRRMLRRVVG
jgi:hypothetical protein